MKKEDAIVLKEKLEQGMKSVQERLKDLIKRENKTLGDGEGCGNGDFADCVDSEYLHALQRDIVENKRLLTKYQKAIFRLETGAYGICECGDDISIERLKSTPFVKTCIDCQKNKDEKDKAGRSFLPPNPRTFFRQSTARC